MHKFTSKMPSQRQLKVGELIRQKLAQLFMRGEYFIPELEGQSITVSEVRISPDLKNATAFVSALGSSDNKNLIKVLNESSSVIRKSLSKPLNLRYLPQITFKSDSSFENAERIFSILKDSDQNDGKID